MTSAIKILSVMAVCLMVGCIHRQPSLPADNGFYRFEECKESESQIILTFVYAISEVFDHSTNEFYFRKQFIPTTPGRRFGKGQSIRFMNADGPSRWTNTTLGARNIDETGVTISTECTYSVNGRRGEVNKNIRINWGKNAKGRIGELSYEARWQGSI